MGAAPAWRHVLGRFPHRMRYNPCDTNTLSIAAEARSWRVGEAGVRGGDSRDEGGVWETHRCAQHQRSRACHCRLTFELGDARKVFITSTFAPTALRITFETEGIGKFSPEEIEQCTLRDKKTGNVVGFDLPKKMVIVANHQVRVLSIVKLCL